MPTILITDDEKNIRSTLSRALKLEGYATDEAEHGEAALAKLRSGDVDVLLADLEMPVLDGLGLLERMAAEKIRVPAIVLTAHGTIDRAVKAVRLGAFDFIEKPPVLERILVAVRNALESSQLIAENRRLHEEAGLSPTILGSSAAVRALLETIARVAPSEAAVLVQGENGTGKELVARAIHAGSARSRRPLVTVNCAAIPETLFESELFGHVRGAFTGATEARRGKFQQAHGGTLFLDEVGEIPLAVQPKLLRALDSGEVQRVGGGAAEHADVRVIAATNRDLEKEVAGGRFRQDLFYRLLVVPVRVPPLRERPGDAALLARHFLDVACRRNRVRPKRLGAAAIEAIESAPWPGNVRQLRNAMERIAILSREDEVDAPEIDGGAAGPPGAPAPSGPLDLADELQRYEREVVLAVLERHRWRMAAAARALGLERSHLYRKLKALGIDRPVED